MRSPSAEWIDASRVVVVGVCGEVGRYGVAVTGYG